MQVIRHPAVTGMMTVIYLPSFEEVTGFKQDGVMDKDVVCKVHKAHYSMSELSFVFLHSIQCVVEHALWSLVITYSLWYSLTQQHWYEVLAVIADFTAAA